MTLGWRSLTKARCMAVAIAFGIAMTIATTPGQAQSETTTPSETQVVPPPVFLEPMTPVAEAVQAAMSPDLPDAMVLHYGAHAFAPVWFTEEGLSENMHLAVAAMADANEHALNPNNYGPLKFVDQARDAQTPEDWARLDIEFSQQFIRYATHLSSGRVQPNKVNKALNLFPDRARS